MWSLPFSGCIGHRPAFGAKFEAFPERSKYLRAAAANVLGEEERKSKVFLNARVFLGFRIHRQLANSQGLLQHSAHITHAGGCMADRETRNKRIAVIAGGGIGREAIPAAIEILEAAATRFGMALEFTDFNWGSEFYF